MSNSDMNGLVKVTESGWRSGLSNLLSAAFGSWWRTKAWLIQALIWTAVINGSLAAILWGDSPDGVSVFTLYGVMTMFAAIAVTIVMHETVVSEKKSGTAAWLLSKPVSRFAYILAKLLPNAIGVIVTMIFIPSSALYVQFVLAGLDVMVGRFALGALVAALNLLFYLTLTLMLGTLFENGAPVIGISLAFAFGQQFLSNIPCINTILPWSLLVPTGGSDVSAIGAIVAGHSVANPFALIFTGGSCVIFSAIAFWKFARTEL